MTKLEVKKQKLSSELKTFLLESHENLDCSIYKNADSFCEDFANKFYSTKNKKCFNEVLDTCKV